MQPQLTSHLTFNKGQHGAFVLNPIILRLFSFTLLHIPSYLSHCYLTQEGYCRSQKEMLRMLSFVTFFSTKKWKIMYQSIVQNSETWHLLVSRKFEILHITKQLIQRLKTNKCLKSEERLFKGQVEHEIHTGHKRSQQQLSHTSYMDYHKINAELSVATETKEILTYSIFTTDLNGDTKRRTTGKRDTFGEGRTAGPMEKYQSTLCILQKSLNVWRKRSMSFWPQAQILHS